MTISDRNVNFDIVTSHTHMLSFHPLHTQTHTARYSTSCDGSDEWLDGDSPWVVPGPDDKHHSQRLRLDVDGVRDGEQVLLHGPRSSPVLQLPDGEADLSLQTQSLVQLGPHLTLGVKTVTLGLFVALYTLTMSCT